MPIVKINGLDHRTFKWNDFVIENLSEFGCVIFPSDCRLTPATVKMYMKKQNIENVETMTLRLYNIKQQETTLYCVVINKDSNLAPFAFFDKIKLMCSSMSMNKVWYAADFMTDKLLEMDLTRINELGRLKEIRKVLGITKDTRLTIRAVLPVVHLKEYDYYLQKNAFRNEVEKDFDTYSNVMKIETFDKFESYHEIQNKIDKDRNCLVLKKDTILDFSIDEPSLDIECKCLRAKDLNVRDIKAPKDLIFIDNIKCRDIECEAVLAESIECENITAEMAKANYKYGIKTKKHKE